MAVSPVVQQAFDAPTGTTVTANSGQGIKTFKQRLLKVIFQLPSQSTPGSVVPTKFANGSNTLELTNFRMTAKVVKAGIQQGTMDGAIYGMTLSQMNTLSTLGLKINLVGRTSITLLAGDGPPPGSNFRIVFQGAVQNAYADMNASPDVPFRVQCFSGQAQAVQANPPVSFKGAVDVAVLMAALANQMGLNFDNSAGVSVQLAKTYFPGSALAQMRAAAEAANITASIDNNTLVIFPKNGASKASNTVEVNVGTGMIGYPAFTSTGIMVKSLFNPSLRWGNMVKVTSIIEPANGTWAIITLEHDLDSRVPNGKWQSSIGCYNPTSNPSAGGPLK